MFVPLWSFSMVILSTLPNYSRLLYMPRFVIIVHFQQEDASAALNTKQHRPNHP